MTLDDLTDLHTEVKERRNQLNSGSEFLRDMREIAAKIRENDPNDFEIHTARERSLSYLEVALEGRFDSAEDAPVELLDERNWTQQASLRSTNGEMVLYLKDKCDLRINE